MSYGFYPVDSDTIWNMQVYSRKYGVGGRDGVPMESK